MRQVPFSDSLSKVVPWSSSRRKFGAFWPTSVAFILAASEGENVAHSCRFRGKVGTVVGALPDDDGDAIDDVDAVVEQLLSLVRVVGCQLDVRNAHGVEHFGGEVVPASISREAEGEVGIQRVVPLVLEGIGLHLGVQTDAS